MALAVAPAANGKTRTKPFSAGDETTVKQRPLNGRCVRGRLMGISNVWAGDRVFCNVQRDHFPWACAWGPSAL